MSYNDRMERIRKHLKGHHIISTLGIAGIAFAVMNFSGTPLFNSLDSFVLFGSEGIVLEQETQVSSGDLGSNREIDIQKDAIVNGNLFADKITLDKNVTINGNVSFSKLKIEKETQILGTQTKPVSLPIANLPEIPDFQIGTQDFRFEGQNNALAAGTYRDITLEKNGRLTLTGGVYNLSKLDLKENSTLIYSAPTTLNIQQELKGQQKVSILPGLNLKPDDLAINYQGKKEKGDENGDDDDNNGDEGDEGGGKDKNKDKGKDKEEDKEKNGTKSIQFGKASFLNFKLLAPKTEVHIGEATTLRGQILARKIKIEKDSILSREEVFEKESDPEKVTEVNREKFVLNEIIVVLSGDATFDDAQDIANLVTGRVIGFVDRPQTYKIEVNVTTPSELDNLITLVESQNNPLILVVLRNSLGALR